MFCASQQPGSVVIPNPKPYDKKGTCWSVEIVSCTAHHHKAQDDLSAAASFSILLWHHVGSIDHAALLQSSDR